MSDFIIISINYTNYAVSKALASALMEATINEQIRNVEVTYPEGYSSKLCILKDAIQVQLETGQVITQEEYDEQQKAKREAEAAENAKAERQELLDLRERVKYLESVGRPDKPSNNVDTDGFVF